MQYMGDALQWVVSYLSNRNRLISIQGKLSIPMFLIYGVVCSFTASGPLVWNSLPERVRCCDSLYTFRRQLKGHLFHSAFPT